MNAPSPNDSVTAPVMGLSVSTATSACHTPARGRTSVAYTTVALLSVHSAIVSGLDRRRARRRRWRTVDARRHPIGRAGERVVVVADPRRGLGDGLLRLREVLEQVEAHLVDPIELLRLELADDDARDAPRRELRVHDIDRLRSLLAGPGAKLLRD